MSDRARFVIRVDWDEETDEANCELTCRPTIIPRDTLDIACAFLMAYAASRSKDGYKAHLDTLRELAMKARLNRNNS